MDEGKRQGLEKLKESLILAAEDMAQANAAAVALRTDTSDDEVWRRALETAMAVSYMRPFTKGAWTLPAKFRPTSELGRDLHQRLEDLRHKVYAHSDRASGRSASIEVTSSTTGDNVAMTYRSAWLSFPVGDLHTVQALCSDQKNRFLAEAASIHVTLIKEDDATV
jgi:hypothetical protein